MATDKSMRFLENEDHHKILLSKLKHKKSVILLGGGKSKLEKQKAQGKLSARERVEYLIDKGSKFFEFGLFAGYGQYEEFGGCPAGGGRSCGEGDRDGSRQGQTFPKASP